MSAKFSQFDLANPALPLELVGVQEGKNVRTGLINPVCEDANGLIEVTTVSCTDVIAVDITAVDVIAVNIACNTINNSTPVTAANIDAYIAAYLAAHP